MSEPGVAAAAAPAAPRRLTFQDLTAPSSRPTQFANSDGVRIAFEQDGIDLGVGFKIFNHGPITAGQGFEILFPVGIGQAAHVKHKVGIGGYAILEAKRLDQYAHFRGRL